MQANSAPATHLEFCRRNAAVAVLVKLFESNPDETFSLSGSGSTSTFFESRVSTLTYLTLSIVWSCISCLGTCQRENTFLRSLNSWLTSSSFALCLDGSFALSCILLFHLDYSICSAMPKVSKLSGILPLRSISWIKMDISNLETLQNFFGHPSTDGKLKL